MTFKIPTLIMWHTMARHSVPNPDVTILLATNCKFEDHSSNHLLAYFDRK